MTVNLVPAADVEYFESAKDVTLEDDRVETDILVQGWGKKLRIRALSFAQMELINAKATNKDGNLDHAEWVYWTIKEGVIRPLFTYNAARELADNNGEFVRALADEIWQVGRISKRVWDSYLLEQKRLSDIETTGNPDADEESDDDN